MEMGGMIVIRPYCGKWTIYELRRKLALEDIEEIIKEVNDEDISNY
ncbi:hypothetical protein GCM10007112_04910 [Vulcanisaeta souniana JCM 11219]|uniref:Uncharacterized protein n=2 Tax=Vulcanisaeta souniana JCM 11219 TaxID=1293586 RepID=A0A830ECF3_9CREN|nr:hypothetical protein GCM10007112_04910 [Vulcanisaeta souniana JCM 11219]